MVESKFQTSFIPKKPIETRPATARRRRPAGLFRLLATLILLVSLATWGGLYLWKVYLNSRIESSKQSILNSEKEFDTGTVNTLVRLDNRLNAAQSLMNNHIAMSKLFALLQNITLKNVRFNDFNLTYGGPDKGMILTMKGQAASYGAVARQSDTFSQSHVLRSPIFADLNLDQSGKIVFSVSANIDPRDFGYGGVANTQP